MTVNWGTVLTSVISGAVVAWPGVVVTVWLSHQRLKQHLDVKTSQQTGDIRQLTDDQTAQLLRRRWWKRWA